MGHRVIQAGFNLMRDLNLNKQIGTTYFLVNYEGT